MVNHYRCKYDAGEGKLHSDVYSFGGLVPYNIENNGIQKLTR